jgi:hypothetical protein
MQAIMNSIIGIEHSRSPGVKPTDHLTARGRGLRRESKYALAGIIG